MQVHKKLGIQGCRKRPAGVWGVLKEPVLATMFIAGALAAWPT